MYLPDLSWKAECPNPAWFKNPMDYLLKLIQIPGPCLWWAPGTCVSPSALGSPSSGRFGKVLNLILAHKDAIRQNCPREGPDAGPPFLKTQVQIWWAWNSCSFPWGSCSAPPQGWSSHPAENHGTLWCPGPAIKSMLLDFLFHSLHYENDRHLFLF